MISLAELVLQHLGEEVVVPFQALNGHRVEVTAVLERTAVVHDGDITAKRVVRLDSLAVNEPDVIFRVTPKTMWLRAGAKGRKNSMAATGRVGRGPANQGQRRFNRDVLGKQIVLEADVLRARGLRRCPKCKEVKDRRDFKSAGWCATCNGRNTTERRRASA